MAFLKRVLRALPLVLISPFLLLLTILALAAADLAAKFGFSPELLTRRRPATRRRAATVRERPPPRPPPPPS